MRLWSKIGSWGTDPEATGKIVRFGVAENYWSMGDGPGKMLSGFDRLIMQFLFSL